METKTKMICVRCKKQIFKEEHYIKVEEMIHEKPIKINYVHKICWDEMIVEKDTKKQALGMLKNIMSKVNNTGLLN